MNIKAFIKKKGVATYINLAVLILTTVTFIVYLKYATSADGLMMPWVAVMLAAVIVCEIVLFFFDNDYIPVIVPLLSMIALGCFAYKPPETLGSIVDYFQNIVMFGNPENFKIIVSLIVLMFITGITSIVSCFFDRVRKRGLDEKD